MGRRYALSVVSAVGRSIEEKGGDKEHSGRLLLRMPRTLHADLARAAERQGVSLNQLIVGLLSGSIAGAEGPAAGAGEPGATQALGTAAKPAGLRLVLVANLVVLVLAGAIAVALLVVALRGGF
jgi:hypothetical protein